jgi:hypothetical protein
MDADVRTRCAELFRTLAARKPREDELDALLARASTYEEFRVLLVTSGAIGSAGEPLARRWQLYAEQHRRAPDSNDLLHKIEHLEARQLELERQAEQLASAMREKLRSIDDLVDRVATLNERSRQTNRLFSRYRAAISAGRDAKGE